MYATARKHKFNFPSALAANSGSGLPIGHKRLALNPAYEVRTMLIVSRRRPWRYNESEILIWIYHSHQNYLNIFI